MRRAISYGSPVRGPAHGGNAADLVDAGTRCQDCQHPWDGKSLEDGWWEPTGDGEWDRRTWNQFALDSLSAGREPSADEFFAREHKARIAAWQFSVHYSPCGEGCRHPHAPGRVRLPGQGWWNPVAELHHVGALREAGAEIEASWRHVDVRLLGWPHDLRRSKLALLCTRCLAARSNLD